MKWMLVTIIAPEIVLGKAWGDLIDPKHTLEGLQSFADEDGVPWTLTHSLLANMGGFVIRFNVNRLQDRVKHASTQSMCLKSGTETGTASEGISDTAASTSIAVADGPGVDEEKVQVGSEAIDTKLDSNPVHLNAPQILERQKFGTDIKTTSYHAGGD